jgi:hypothetical protein
MRDIRMLSMSTCSRSSLREFEVCNHLLTIMRSSASDNGYLFGVLNPDSVSARRTMLASAADHFGLVRKGDERALTGKPLQAGAGRAHSFEDSHAL